MKNLTDADLLRIRESNPSNFYEACASEMYGISLDQVTPEHRAAAKVSVFGFLYKSFTFAENYGGKFRASGNRPNFQNISKRSS